MEKAINISSFYYQNCFDGLTLSAEKNKLTAVSGPNNCGKTTLMRILSREIITDSDIEINNFPINMYPIVEYTKMVKCVIPLEKVPKEETIEEELYIESNDTKEVEEILKGLKIKRIANKQIKELNHREFVYYQIATALITNPKILLLDSLDSILTEKETIEVLEFLKEYQKEKDLTIVYTTINLNTTILSDTLYIIGDRKVALKGTPLEVLKYDNIINKIGLNIPFMVDLSVKLKDYNLVENIVLDQERMLDELWK